MSDAMTDEKAATQSPRHLGPWQIQELKSQDKSYGISGVEVVNIEAALLMHGSGGSKSYSKTVCALPVASTPSHNAEWAAVAHLIAAAPELYEALEYLVGESDQDMDDDYNPHAAPLAKAREALAKARGEQCQ